MGLLREGIAAGNRYSEEIQATSKEIAEIGTNIITFLDNNGNFQMFREGTGRGNAIYNDLKKCVDGIVDQLVPTINKIASSTSTLANAQQNLNKADIVDLNERF